MEKNLLEEFIEYAKDIGITFTQCKTAPNHYEVDDIDGGFEIKVTDDTHVEIIALYKKSSPRGVDNCVNLEKLNGNWMFNATKFDMGKKSQNLALSAESKQSFLNCAETALKNAEEWYKKFGK